MKKDQQNLEIFKKAIKICYNVLETKLCNLKKKQNGNETFK